MLVIESVKIIEVDMEPALIFYDYFPHEHITVSVDGHTETREAGIVQEIVQGRRLRRPDGTVLTLGVQGYAAEVLGLHYDEWERLKQERANALAEVEYCTERLTAALNAGFWRRLGWLLFGFR